jgi:regulator of cell morphogenesis and NO signaling
MHEWFEEMQLNESTSICDLLRLVPMMAEVFLKRGVLDEHFTNCVDMGQVVRATGVPLAEWTRQLTLLETGIKYNQATFKALPILEMVQLLRAEHHDFLVRRIPRMSVILRELVVRKGTDQPVLQELRDRFEAFRADISDHILQEQDSLYPYAEQLEHYLQGNLTEMEARALFEKPSPVAHALRADDDVAFFDVARYLTNHYTPPADAGIMQRSLYKELALLEKDLLRHEAVEFEVLLNRVVQLEDRVLKRLAD